MPVFEKKYIYCLWDDTLASKEAFFAEDVMNLRLNVEHNDNDYRDVLRFSGDEMQPFKSKKACMTNWKFAYYDPLYEWRLAAEQGETVQILFKDTWQDVLPDHDWIKHENETYRIKPKEKLATNRQLAEWLARGMGEICFYKDAVLCDMKLSYYNYEEDDEPATEVLVRTWEDVDWSEPTLKYLGFKGYDII